MGVLSEEIWKAASVDGLNKAMTELSVKPTPRSSKSLNPPRRPGFGRVGTKCNVRANHFVVQLAYENSDFHHYDVSITPEVTAKNFSREILNKLVKDHKAFLGGRIPAYDGNKSIYTAGPLPFTTKEFIVEMQREKRGSSEMEVAKFKVAIKLAAKVGLYNLQEYLRGRTSEAPQDAIQVLDIVMRASKPLNEAPCRWCRVLEGLLSKHSAHPNGSFSEHRYGSARPFYESMMVHYFVQVYLNLRDLNRPLNDANRVKVKRALKGLTVELTHLSYKKRSKVTGVSSEPANQLMFTYDKVQLSVSQYFKTKYGIQLQHPFLPCIQTGPSSRPNYVPMEVCKIAHGQKYAKKLNERQVTALLKATCQRPELREESIKKMVKDNRYTENQMTKEFGMNISEMCTTIDARVLPPPMLKYHDSGREKQVAPSVGQWNMIDKKMINGASVNRWTCLSFSNKMDLNAVDLFCTSLVAMCASKGMTFTQKPCIPIHVANPNQIQKALLQVWTEAKQQLQLLIIILPDSSGSYGTIKRICETELGIVSQCCQPRQAAKNNNQYMENVALKINVKAGGRNTVLIDAVQRNIPLLTDRPTIIFGADVTHPPPGEDSSASIAAVVASMDWPEVTKYKGLVSAQAHREEIIQDLYKVVDDPVKGKVHSGMIRELLISFLRNTRQKPDRIIFFRDGVSEGQFSQVLLHEVNAIWQACASLEEGYLPRVTFVVVQKRHHTRLFPVDNRMTDKSGNILPGTVVDTNICHPSEFDFYLCSHAGIQGTSRPSHYHVLYDENNFTADLLQLLANSLCYTFARCTRSVSIVPPAYYAHLLAFRARYYVEGLTLSDSGSTSGGKDLTAERQALAQALPKIKDSVKDVMFYC
uniref:Uncharacterized protein n=1 Tax=Chenopodium quinoa TaxID=63459 RepID=A0A803MLG5_CHEQI